MATDIARLQIEIDSRGVLDAKGRLVGFSKQAKKAETATSKLASAWKTFGVALGAAVVIQGFRSIVRATSVAELSLAQLQAGLKSTGDASGQTLESLTALADEMQRTTVFGDELVESAEAILLSFTNISGDVFPATVKAAADVATRMGTSLQSAVVQLGKALNDPVQNLGALSRAGIQFSKDQKTLIKSLVETNQIAAAQKIILGELEFQYGGSAEAARDTMGGAFKALANSFGDLQEVVGQSLGVFVIPTVKALTVSLQTLSDVVSLLTFGEKFAPVADAWFKLQEAGEGVAAMEKKVAAMFERRRAAAAKLAAEEVARVWIKQQIWEWEGKYETAGRQTIAMLEGQIRILRDGNDLELEHQAFLAGGTAKYTERITALLRLKKEYTQQVGIKAWIKTLREEADTLDMTATDKAYYVAITKGATREQAVEVAELVESIEARRERTRADQEAREILGGLQTEQERVIAQMKLLSEAELRGAISTEAWAKAFIKLREQLDKAKGSLRGVPTEIVGFTEAVEEDLFNFSDVAESAVTGWGRGFIDTLFDAERRSKLTFESIATDFATMVAKMMAEQALLQFLGGLFGPAPTPSASGNAFSGGRVVPMARGGVVDRPTIFPMARGAGLMGESGPEAVMPLTRTSSGDLGVNAEGAGSVVNVNIINNTDARVTESRRENGQRTDIDVVIGDAVEGQITRGRFDRALAGNFGVHRRGTAR